MNNNLNAVFNITSNNLPVIQTPKPQPVTKKPDIDKSEKEILRDYESTREDFDILMLQGKAALEEILTIATQSQNARFFEAAALMLKTLADTNMARIDVHEKLYKIKKLKQELGLETGPKIEKAIFIGSTSDLLQQINPRPLIDSDTKEIEYEEI